MTVACGEEMQSHPVVMPGAVVFTGSVAVTVVRASGRTEKRLIAETVFALLDMPIK
jgi:hypothetical protein